MGGPCFSKTTLFDCKQTCSGASTQLYYSFLLFALSSTVVARKLCPIAYVIFPFHLQLLHCYTINLSCTMHIFSAHVIVNLPSSLYVYLACLSGKLCEEKD